MLSRRFFVIALVTSFISFNSAIANAADFAQEAESFIQTMADKAMNSFRTVEDEATRQKEFRALLNDGFDVRAIGKWVLGRYWRKASEAEKEEYLGLFEDFIVATYSARFKDYSSEDITFKVIQSIAKNDQDAIVRSQIDRPQATEPIYVDWRIKANKDGTMKVVDVLIAGVSMSQTQRSEFTSVIKRNGENVAGLIEALKSKTSQLVSNVEQATKQ